MSIHFYHLPSIDPHFTAFRMVDAIAHIYFIKRVPLWFWEVG